MSKVCPVCHTACSDETKYCPNCSTRLPAPGMGKPTSMYDDHGHPHSTMGPELPERKPFWKRDSRLEVPSARPASQYNWSQSEHPHSTVAPKAVYQQNTAAHRPAAVPNNANRRTLNGTPTDRTMVWHTLLVYVVLFITAFSYLIQGASALTGGLYSGSASSLYYYVPSLQMIDTLYGVALLLLAALSIYTRSRLAGFYRNGPACLLLMILVSMFASLAHAVASAAALSVIGTLSADAYADAAGSFVGSMVYFILNYVYFRNRSEKFIRI